MENNILENIISSKAERQELLKNRQQDLEQLTKGMSSSILSTFLYSIKYVLLIIIGLILSFGSVFFFIAPTFVLPESEIQNTIIEAAKLDYYEKSNESINESLIKVVNYPFEKEQQAHIKSAIQNFDTSIETTVEKELYDNIRLISFLTLALSLSILYIARLIRKNHNSNEAITTRKKTLQNIINDYESTITEEAKEIDQLNQLLEKKS